MKKVLLLCFLWATTLAAQDNRGRITSILETLDTHTGQRSVVREFPFLIEAPNWTRDGKWLIYNHNGHLYRIRANGKGQPSPIDTGCAIECNNDHVLSADEKSVTISSGYPGMGGSYLFVLPLKGGQPRLVSPLSPSYLHGWSPDGQTLAYCAFRDKEEGDIYIIPANGGREQRLTNAPGLDDGPEYAPDGEHIWFNSVRTGLMQVWRMKADGSEQTQMTFDTQRNAWFPHVSPDGKHVVYLTYHKGDLEPNQHLANKNVELWLMTSEGGEPKRIAELFGGQGTINTNSWAPDSHRIAFVSYKLGNK